MTEVNERARQAMGEDGAATVDAATRERLARRMRRRGDESRWWWLVPTLYILFLLVPIYWLINMSFKTNEEIVSSLTLFPHAPTLRNYHIIFTQKAWYSGYINSITYVVMNMVISVAVALPAAYAFSRYRFLGDKHLFFWLLTNLMAPAWDWHDVLWIGAIANMLAALLAVLVLRPLRAAYALRTNAS